MTKRSVRTTGAARRNVGDRGPGQPVSAPCSQARSINPKRDRCRPSAGITVTINADGTATVTGAVNAADNGLSSDRDRSDRKRPQPFQAECARQGQHVASHGLNEGYLTPDGQSAFISRKSTTSGRKPEDTFIIDQRVRHRGIDGGGGLTEVQIGGFVALAGTVNFTKTRNFDSQHRRRRRRDRHGSYGLPDLGHQRRDLCRQLRGPGD